MLLQVQLLGSALGRVGHMWRGFGRSTATARYHGARVSSTVLPGCPRPQPGMLPRCCSRLPTPQLQGFDAAGRSAGAGLHHVPALGMGSARLVRAVLITFAWIGRNLMRRPPAQG